MFNYKLLCLFSLVLSFTVKTNASDKQQQLKEVLTIASTIKRSLRTAQCVKVSHNSLTATGTFTKENIQDIRSLADNYRKRTGRELKLSIKLLLARGL